MPADERKLRVGAYAKLLANYAADDALIEAGEAAELLFVRGLAFCATADADGYITDAQVTRVVGAGMRDAAKRAVRLAECGVWQRVDGGYVVRSWLKIHESAERKGRRLAADRERKKAEKEGKTPPDSTPDSERNPNGGTPDSLSLIHDTARHDTAGQVESSLGGERPVTLRTVDATTPTPNSGDDECCLRHPDGNPADEPCRGCQRVEERRTKRAGRDAEKAARAAEAAARTCPRCDGAHIIDAEGRPTRRKCGHGVSVRPGVAS